MFLFRRLLCATIAATLLFVTGASASAPQPKVKGNQIIDAVSERTFIPRGVNFPGFEYACQQGWSYGEAGTEPDEAGATVAAMASWKINTVRLPLNQDCWIGEDGLPSGGLTVNGYRQAVENFVSTLNSAGIVAVLVLHWSGPNGSLADGLRPMPDSSSPAFWASVANRFKDNPSVIFDLFNEPHSRWNKNGSKVFGLSWDCWANGGCQAPLEVDTAPISGVDWYPTQGLKALTAVVRGTGAKQPILLSGIDYANDLRGWKAHAPDDDQLIAGFHNYPVQRCHTVNCWNSEIAPLAAKVPLLAAELGQNDCGEPDHVKRFMDWADKRWIGYLAWAWWVLPELGCHNYALISNLNGTPLPPVGTTLHDRLEALEQRLGPGEEPPITRRPADLKLRDAIRNKRFLRVRATIDPFATAAVIVRIRLIRDARSKLKPRTNQRVITKRPKANSGKVNLRVRIPVGLRPRLVILSYTGDKWLLTGRVRSRPSVSRVTR